MAGQAGTDSDIVNSSWDNGLDDERDLDLDVAKKARAEDRRARREWGAGLGIAPDEDIAASATHEEQIGKINATNEEDGTNGGEKHEERLAKILTDHAIFVAVNRDAPSLVGFGIGLLNPRRDAFHLFASLLQRDTGFQAGPGNHPVIVAGHL